MKLSKLFLVAMLFATLSFVSCDNNDSNAENTSSIQLKLVDAEGEYEKVLVNIVDVQYNRNDGDSGWTSFEGFTLPNTDDSLNRVDLTELVAGNTLVLTDEDIESGNLNQIRLILGEGNALVLVLDGETTEIPLSTPSAMQSGLKLHLNTTLEPGFSYTFILDWDVQKSIVKAGTSGNYNLKPVIRVIAEVNSGTILGRVADALETETVLMPLDNATIYVFDETDTTFLNSIATTSSDGEGLFNLQGLPEGNYLLKIEKSDFTPFTSTVPIEVNKGLETNVGTILLTKITP
ncbi:MAG: DUF4382 domain-containing protein [Lutibacter sp.]|nr:DUF4382 domain-containing protein [Lutibacter sp.]